MLIHRQRTLAKLLLLVFIALLVAVEPILFDLNSAAWGRSIEEVKTELDQTHKKYIDSVKSGTETSSVYSLYEGLLQEYNKLKTAEEAKKPADVETPTDDSNSISKLFKKFKEVFKPPWKEGKKEMSLFEKIAWGIGKALVPTLAVIGFAAFVTLPIGWMAVAAMAIGGISGGGMKYLYEKRMNRYRDVAKTSEEIFRDVSISGITEAIMAPFNLVSMGLAGRVIKQASKKVIAEYAIKSGATYFAGRVLSSGLGGGLKHVWHKNIFQDHLKVANLEKECDRILARHSGPDSPPLSQEEQVILAQLDSEITRLKANDYTMKSFSKDVQKAAVGAVISGAGGMFISKWAANSSMAAKVSMKIFKDTKHTGMVSHWIMSNPTSFLSGAANANLSKRFITDDIHVMEDKRNTYSKDSPVWNYYNAKVDAMVKQREAISPMKEGLKTAATNFAIQSGMVAVSAAKINLIDLPRARKAEIQKRFMESSAEGQKYDAAKQRYDEVLKSKPTLDQVKQYGGVKELRAARTKYFAELREAKTDMQRNQILAEGAFKNIKNTQVYKDLAKSVDMDIKMDQRIELARFMGDKQLVEAWKVKLKQTPGNENKSNTELEIMARKSIQSEYTTKATKLKENLDDYDAKVKKYAEVKQSGAASGSDLKNNYVWRKVARNNNQLTREELQAIEFQARNLPPSQYKAMYVDWKIAALKGQGASDKFITDKLPSFQREADSVILQMHGGSWRSVIAAESVAGLVKKIPYDEEGDVDLLEKISIMISKDIPTKIEQAVIKDYQTKVNNEIKNAIIPRITTGSDTIQGETIDKFLETFVDQSVKTTSDGVVNSGVNRIHENVSTIKQEVGY